MSDPKQPRTKPGTPRPSEPSLSAVARHVVLPVGIVTTGWPAVRDKCRDLGIRFQHWQDGAGRCILAKREDGQYAAGIGGVAMSIPRQTGKTFLIGAIVFALCLLNPGITVLWTAHRLRTAKETFRSMDGMTRRKLIKPHISHVRRGSGDQEIEFRNGSRILFGARENGFGRGFARVAVIVFDEAQILTDDALDDMVPAANAHENPLVIYTGTPPKPTDPGDVFARMRTKALAGQSENTLYIELSADYGTDPAKWPKGHIDWEQVARANPSFPIHTPRAAVMRMMEQLGPASFLLEGLGIWHEETGPPRTIQLDRWDGLKTTTPPTVGRVAVGVKFSLDGKRVAAAVGRRGGSGVHVEVVGTWPASEGSTTITSWLKGAWRDFATVVIDGKSGAGALRQSLLDAGLTDAAISLPTVAEVQTAHAMTLAAIEDGTLSHANQPGLNAAVAVATQREIGKAGGWGWQPIGDGDVLPLDAVTYALHGAVTAKLDHHKTSAPRRIY